MRVKAPNVKYDYDIAVRGGAEPLEAVEDELVACYWRGGRVSRARDRLRERDITPA